MRLYSFPVSRALGGKCRRLSRFAIFFYRIWHRFMSILRGVRIFWVFVGGNSNYRLYFNTVNYNHISFLNTRSHLVWVQEEFGTFSSSLRKNTDKSHVLQLRFIFEERISFALLLLLEGNSDFLNASWKALVSSHIPKRVDCFKLEEDQTIWYRRWNLAVLVHRE